MHAEHSYMHLNQSYLIYLFFFCLCFANFSSSSLVFIVNQNGKMLSSLKSHNVAVVCLNWEEDGQHIAVCLFQFYCGQHANLSLIDEITLF